MAITLPNPLRMRNAGGAEDRISLRLFAGGEVRKARVLYEARKRGVEKRGNRNWT